jgi:hypothetical protein
MRLHVLGSKKTRTVPLGGKADDGNGFGSFENVPQLLNIVVHKEF